MAGFGTPTDSIWHSVTGENNQLAAVAVGSAVILATTAVYHVLSRKEEGHEFPKLRGIQLYHAWNFLQRRYDFLQSGYERSLGKSFSFDLLDHKIIALTGEDARQMFFSHPHFSIDDGYKLLVGAVRLSPNCIAMPPADPVDLRRH